MCDQDKYIWFAKCEYIEENEMIVCDSIILGIVMNQFEGRKKGNKGEIV